MRGRRQLLLLLVIMLVVALGVGGIALYSLYRAAFKQQRERLEDLARSEARMIETIARFNEEYSSDFPGGAFAATLQELRDAQSRFEGLGETGQFLLGRREDDRIVYLLQHRFIADYPTSIPFDAKFVEPMRRALLGWSGTIVSRGYRGKMTLAAYEPVAAYDLGIVAKIDVEEIQAPFLRAGLMAAGAGFILIALGAVLFLRVGNPILRRIEESEKRYRSMFESAEDRLFLAAPDGAILDVNPAASSTYGFSRDEFVGRNIKELVHPELHEAVQDAFRAVAQGRTIRRESVHLKKDGMAFPVEVQLSPITHRGQAAILAAARDISARKQAEEALRKSEGRYRALSESLEEAIRAKVAELKQAESLAAIGRMVSIVAHEIRNPLQNINMGVETLKAEIKEDLETRETFQQIDYGIDLLNVTVKELLDYAKPVQLQYSLISVGEMVRHAGRLAAPQPPNITIKTELEEEDREIPADVPKMTRAFLNILSNAIEAMPNGGMIEIRSEMHQLNGAEYLKLSISDNGPGMNEEQLERVFEPFFTTKPRGTGLGLAICKKIVDAHHGILRIHSKPGEGTTVEIILPASQE